MFCPIGRTNRRGIRSPIVHCHSTVSPLFVLCAFIRFSHFIKDVLLPSQPQQVPVRAVLFWSAICQSGSSITGSVTEVHTGLASKYGIKAAFVHEYFPPGIFSQTMDPTYPLIPVVSLIAAFLMLLTILTNVYQTWNAGVLMLCTWLFLSDLIEGVEAIIWSNNADNKAPVWCDISSRVSLASNVGSAACSLVITRRLFHIACLRTVDAPTRRERRVHYFLDFFIGIGLPILVGGPFYYIVQSYRFEVLEEVGCGSTVVSSGLTTILVSVWPVILPLISAMFYCPRIIWTFYRQRRDVDEFFRSNGSVDRPRYFRILAVGCLDILFVLPTGALAVLVQITQEISFGKYPFYPGWYYTHHPWAPVSLSAAEWHSDFWVRFDIILPQWLYPVLSILIFAIYGLRGESRATYRRGFWTAAGVLGFKLPMREDVPDMKFGTAPRRWVQSLGRSLSMPGSSMMEDVDLTISVHSTLAQPRTDARVVANEVVEIAHEDHSRARDSLVGAPPAQQARNANEVEGDVEKEPKKAETV
ncbi:pheromone A receptor-domain-containing protein [Amylostereum chailletii]|nr:pheromone A receptor-domain-containing protein [Amylostereum chailletii]